MFAFVATSVRLISILKAVAQITLSKSVPEIIQDQQDQKSLELNKLVDRCLYFLMYKRFSFLAPLLREGYLSNVRLLKFNYYN